MCFVALPIVQLMLCSRDFIVFYLSGYGQSPGRRCLRGQPDRPRGYQRIAIREK